MVNDNKNNDDKNNDDNDRNKLRKDIALSLLKRLHDDFFFYKDFMKVVSRIEKDGENISIDDSLYLVDAIFGDYEDDVARIVGRKPETIMDFIIEIMQSDDIKSAADNISLKK